jgi:hypothetical protein
MGQKSGTPRPAPAHADPCPARCRSFRLPVANRLSAHTHTRRPRCTGRVLGDAAGLHRNNNGPPRVVFPGYNVHSGPESRAKGGCPPRYPLHVGFTGQHSTRSGGPATDRKPRHPLSAWKSAAALVLRMQQRLRWACVRLRGRRGASRGPSPAGLQWRWRRTVQAGATSSGRPADP